MTWYSVFKLSGCTADTVRPIISGIMTVTMGAGTRDYNYCVELHWHLSFHKFWRQKFFRLKEKHHSFDMKSIFRVYRIIAWPICNQCLNLLDKILMSVFAQVFKFDSSVSCKQNKFQQKIHSKWKMWMINFINRYRFSCMPMILYCLGRDKIIVWFWIHMAHKVGSVTVGRSGKYFILDKKFNIAHY